MADQIRVDVYEDSFFPARMVRVTVPIDNEFLRQFWGKDQQPDLRNLESRIRQVVSEWLEGNSDERRNSAAREHEYLARRIGPTEFFD